MQVILPTEQVQEIQSMITELLQHEISFQRRFRFR